MRWPCARMVTAAATTTGKRRRDVEGFLSLFRK
jgi:hypothetical protein